MTRPDSGPNGTSPTSGHPDAVPPSPEAVPPAGEPAHDQPAQPEYPTALEAPEPTPAAMPGRTGAVPDQAAGAHDRPGAAVFAPGAAPVPPPAVPSGPRYPASGSGAGAGEPPSPGRRGRVAGLVAVSVVAALLLVAAGLVGYLWWDTRVELDETRVELTGQIEDRDDAIERRDRTIQELTGDLQSSRDSNSLLEQEVEGTRRAQEELRREKRVIRKCVVLMGEANALAAEGDVEGAAEKAGKAEKPCAETGEIVGF